MDSLISVQVEDKILLEAFKANINFEKLPRIEGHAKVIASTTNLILNALNHNQASDKVMKHWEPILNRVWNSPVHSLWVMPVAFLQCAWLLYVYKDKYPEELKKINPPDEIVKWAFDQFQTSYPADAYAANADVGPGNRPRP